MAGGSRSDQHIAANRQEFCTCTIACIPQGLLGEQVCRLRAENDAATSKPFWINGGRFANEEAYLTGAQIRALPMPSIRDTDDLYMEVPGSEDLIVQYDEVVPVAGRRFFSVPSIINAGSSDAAKVAWSEVCPACKGAPGQGHRYDETCREEPPAARRQR